MITKNELRNHGCFATSGRTGNDCYGVRVNCVLEENTVGARKLNEFGIRMVHSRSVLVPTIRKQNIQNGRFRLGCFIYKEEMFYVANGLG